MSKPGTQRDLARQLLQRQGIARLSEFKTAGITAATISRMLRDDEVVRLARGLYQLPDAEIDANHSLAEAAKRVPKVIMRLCELCLCGARCIGSVDKHRIRLPRDLRDMAGVAFPAAETDPTCLEP